MRDQLERIARAGIAACLPERVLPPHLPPAPRGRIIALAIGKAAGGMAAVAERHYGDRLEGIAVVPHGTPVISKRMGVHEAGHPVPDTASVAAAERLLALASEAGPEDLLLVLLSGGASALACLPGDALTLAAKQKLTEALLRSGAPITEINCVRRHLSRIKGGRLALAAAPARLLTLAISDVAGDAPADIGSGPAVADPTTLKEARAILARYGIADQQAGWSETPKEVSGEFKVIAAARDALRAAAAEALALGYRVDLIGECYGDAAETGRDHAESALRSAPGTVLISGGELGVRVGGAGRGGRNRHYALAAAIRLAGRADIAGLAADSDGIDGTTDAAGAFFDGGTVACSARDPRAALAEGDSGTFFAALGDQWITGPTGTNVNDLRIILVAR